MSIIHQNPCRRRRSREPRLQVPVNLMLKQTIMILDDSYSECAATSRISFISGGPARFKVPIEVASLACQLRFRSRLRCAVANHSQLPTSWRSLFGSARRGLWSTPSVAEQLVLSLVPSQKRQRFLLIRNCAIDDA